MKNCRDCKHFRPDRGIYNLWGLIRDKSFYYKYARCARGQISGGEPFCSVQRASEWPDYVATCNLSGRGFEPKD